MVWGASSLSFFETRSFVEKFFQRAVGYSEATFYDIFGNMFTENRLCFDNFFTKITLTFRGHIDTTFAKKRNFVADTVSSSFMHLSASRRQNAEIKTKLRENKLR